MSDVYCNEFDPTAAMWLRQLMADGLIPKGEVDERSITDVPAGRVRSAGRAHFFAGVGGWELALQLAGWDPARPVWTGSCPCQPFSSAGKRKAEEDARDLWPAFFKLIAECRPPVVFGEQVASADVVGKVGGKHRGATRRVWVDRVRADLEAAGYAFGACVLGAHSLGAPHIRQRLYWVARDLAHAGQQSPRLALAGSGAGAAAEPPERRAEALGESGRRGDAGELADGAQHGRGQGDTDERRGREGIRAQGHGRGPADGCGAGVLGDTTSDGRQEHERRPGPGEEPDAPHAGGEPGRVGDPDRTGPQPRGRAAEVDGYGRAALADGRAGVALDDADGEREASAGPHGTRPGVIGWASEVGFWGQYGLVSCRDEKARRVEPGAFPLAHGVPRELGPLLAVLERMGVAPDLAKRAVRNARSRLARAGKNRVGRLRGYGNAIVPELAAAFVKAFLACEAGASAGTQTRAAA